MLSINRSELEKVHYRIGSLENFRTNYKGNAGVHYRIGSLEKIMV